MKKTTLGRRALEAETERLERLVDVVQRIAAERNAERVGRVEEVLVEGDPLARRPLVVGLGRAGDDEELALALPAQLLVEVVRRAADLADQVGTFSPPGPE